MNPVNPCSFVMIHGNELLHLITGASRGVNPSIIINNFIRCVSIHGEDIFTHFLL